LPVLRLRLFFFTGSLAVRFFHQLLLELTEAVSAIKSAVLS